MVRNAVSTALATFLAACAVGDAPGTSGFGAGAGPGGNDSSATATATATGTGGDSSGGGSATGTGTGSSGSDSGPATGSGGSTGAVCGDGMVQPGEDCEALDFAGKSCADFGFDAGDLICTNDCTISTEACFACGDGTKQAAEACDGQDFGGKTCITEGFAGGSLQCSVDCQSISTSGCQQAPTCGDGKKDPGEQCDGADLGGQSCSGLGFDSGSLSCSGNCTFDTSQCQNDNPNCLGFGEGICLSDSDCCPPGVNGIVLQSCQLFTCT